MTPAEKEKIRHAVEMFYDLQQLRLQSGARTKSLTAELDDKDREFLAATSQGLDGVEKEALKNVKRLLKGVPIYEQWIKHQKGVGPTLGGVLVAGINIENCHTSGQLWAWCGLAVDKRDGKAQRRKKGEKAGYNPWLKAKLVKVLGECLLRANSLWREFYDNYKHRKQTQNVPQCMACEGKGKIEGAKCGNCAGMGGPAPWGRSDGHRHQAAMRYMVKQFLLELWRQWRTIEGYPVRPSYQEEYLGHVHGAAE